MSRGGDSEICIFSIGSFPKTYSFRYKKKSYRYYCSRSCWAMWRTTDARDCLSGLYKRMRFSKGILKTYSSWYDGYICKAVRFLYFSRNVTLGWSRMRLVRSWKGKYESIWFYICSFWWENHENWDCRLCDGFCSSESVKESYIRSLILTRKRKIHKNTICSVR